MDTEHVHRNHSATSMHTNAHTHTSQQTIINGCRPLTLLTLLSGVSSPLGSALPAVDSVG